MNRSTESCRILRFGDFQLDLRAGELQKHGLRIRLQEQPFKVLVLLLTRPGGMVTREELHSTLWPGDTFVDFEHGLNNIMNRLREVLGDSSETPRFIETLPRRGYRFVGSVRSLEAEAVSPDASAVAPTPEQIHSVAVLPLENLSGDPSQEYFVDGMTDILITDLAQISALRVISRTSVMRYKGVRKSLPEIANELDVDAIVEGSVVRSGNRVRINAQLIHAPTDRHLWARSYERDEKDVLVLQGELLQAIAGEIRIALTPQEQARLANFTKLSPEAHEAYLKGRYYWNMRTGEGFKKAVEYFRLATEKEPRYALAYAGLADAFLLMSGYSVVPRTETIAQARAAAGKALELDSGLAEPHASLGLIAVSYDYDWSGAEREYQRAIQLNPNYASAHQWYGEYLALVGRFDEGIAEMSRAQALDPVSPIINTETGEVLFLARRYDEAIERLSTTLEMFPAYLRAHTWLARTYGQKGMFKEALAHLSKARSLDDTPYTLAFSGYVEALSGETAHAQKALDELVCLCKRQYVDPALIAIVDMALGHKTQAFAWLEKAFLDHSPRLTALRVSPEYDRLRSDPRFQALLHHVGLLP